MTNKNAKSAAKATNEHLLTTKIKDLTPEILAQLEKPLGTSQRPFPMSGTQRIEYDGRSNLEYVLSVIADDSNPMKVYSERPYNEMISLAYCDMVVPSMLKLFFEGLERRKPESINRTQMVIGDPGAGKSFMGAMQGRLRSNQRVEIFDCGGKNMNDLLFEMVLDFGAGDALPMAIDKRLAAGSLQSLSLAKLKNLPGDSVTVEDGQVKSIDWNYFKGVAKTGEVDDAFTILKEVSQIEGLDHAGGNALGMNSQYGPLIKWFMEGREGVLDEYNKSREGSDNALQTVWQFLIGELNTCTVENPLKNKDATSGPSSFTFRREDVKAGFFVTLTGNKTEDGITTRSLNKSVYSRLSPKTLPDPDVADWQHRICQMMVGVPVSTLYTVFKEQADKNPAAFGQWMLELRKTKAEIEGIPVSELQETLILNWQNVVHSSEKLARFYDKWATLTNADKVMQSGNSDLVEEVDEEYAKKEGIDFRKIKQHLEEAIPIRPHAQSADAPVTIDFRNFTKPPVLGEKIEENPSLNFGTRLVDFLDQTVYEKTEAVGKHRLYEKLRKSMDEFGLRDLQLVEGARSGQKSVEEDLNISAFSGNNPTKQAQMARKVLCDYLRSVDTQIVEQDDDKIMTIDRLRSALKAVGERNTAESKEIFFVNRDHETLVASPLASARIEDNAAYVAKDKELQLKRSDLVSHEDFMAALALPVVSGKNMAAIWDGNIRQLNEALGDSAANQNAPHDEAIDIAENRSALGLATTTLSVLFEDAKGKADVVSVHVVLNTARNKALVVGEKVPSKLLTAFKEAGIVHVDRHDPNARAKVEAALSDLTRSMPDSARQNLRDAFKYRNDVDDSDSAPLSDLLVNSKVEVTYGKYLVKGHKKSL
jgi:hypothetical protein